MWHLEECVWVHGTKPHLVLVNLWIAPQSEHFYLLVLWCHAEAAGTLVVALLKEKKNTWWKYDRQYVLHLFFCWILWHERKCIFHDVSRFFHALETVHSIIAVSIVIWTSTWIWSPYQRDRTLMLSLLCCLYQVKLFFCILLGKLYLFQVRKSAFTTIFIHFLLTFNRVIC